MVNFVQPNIGQAFGAGVQVAEQAEDRKIRNRLLDYQVGKAQREDEAATAVRGAIPGAIKGDPQATQTVQQFNPELWMKLDTQKRETDKVKVDAVGRAFTGIKNAPPEQRQTMWDYAKADLAKNGVDVADMGPMYNPGYVDWHLAKATSVAEQMKMAESKFTNVAPGGTLVDNRSGKPVFTAPEKPPAPTELANLTRERDALPQGDPRRAMYDAKLAKETAPRAGEDQSFKNANSLRDEFRQSSKDFVTVQDAYAKIRTAAADKSGAGDMSMLYAYVKLLDPTSVVRESEFATAAASGSLGERVQGAALRVLSGERLPDSLRTDFLRQAQKIYGQQKAGYDKTTEQYTRLANHFGIDPKGIIVEFARPELDQPLEAAPGGLPAGPGSAQAAPSAPLPQGVPPGSKLIGTSGGKPVYQTPDGGRLRVD